MPLEIIDASGKLLQIRIRGMLHKADDDRIIQIAKEAVAREGKIQALVILDGFEGWERSDDWDVSFVMDQGHYIEKLAIVGDEKWKDDVFAFTAKGLRPTAIEFFASSRLPEAHAWLSSRRD